MDNKGLIFIPDISGFTRFVNDMEIEHSRHIIQELLEVVINANQIGLQISEIEGDAILFYKYGNPPALEEIYAQVEKMFCAFHRHLKAYDHRRLCHCKACTGAIDLSLKVITHYGEFTGYSVKNFNKLIGKDIIVAHQLLKNDVEQHEYWLVTNGLSGDQDWPPIHTLDWYASEKKTETGNIPFKYAQLTHLKKDLPPDHVPDYSIKNKKLVLSESRDFDVDILTLLHATVDFHTRNIWNVNIKSIDQVSHAAIPRVGMHHRCILEKGAAIMYTSNYSFTPEKVVYGETDEKKQSAVEFTFEKQDEKKTRLRLDLYLKNNPFLLLMFRLFKKKEMRKKLAISMDKLDVFAKESQAEYPQPVM